MSSSTSSLQSQITATQSSVATSTAAIGVSTASLQTQLQAVGVSTTAIAVATTTIQANVTAEAAARAAADADLHLVKLSTGVPVPVALLDFSTITTALNARVLKAGDTMTGSLVAPSLIASSSMAAPGGFVATSTGATAASLQAVAYIAAGSTVVPSGSPAVVVSTGAGKGVIFNAQTTTERDTMAGKTGGILIFNRTLQQYQYWSEQDAGWVSVSTKEGGSGSAGLLAGSSPTVTGSWTFQNPGSTTTVGGGGIVYANASGGLGNGAYPGVSMGSIKAVSMDGATQSSGCVVAVTWPSGSVDAVAEFRSTTTSTLDINRVSMGVLMERCAPGQTCIVGVKGFYHVQFESGATGGVAEYVRFSGSTRCRPGRNTSFDTQAHGAARTAGSIASDTYFWLWLR